MPARQIRIAQQVPEPIRAGMERLRTELEVLRCEECDRILVRTKESGLPE